MDRLIDDDGSHLVRWTVRAVDPPPTLAGIYQGLSAALHANPMPLLAVDLRALDDLSFDRHEVQALRATWQERSPAGPCPRVAILAGNDLVYGICRMVHNLVHGGCEDLAVFRETGPAARWLPLADASLLDDEPEGVTK